MSANDALSAYTLGYAHYFSGGALVIKANCFEWMKNAPPDSIHAVVTDPPYGVKEYEVEQLEKRRVYNVILRVGPP